MSKYGIYVEAAKIDFIGIELLAKTISSILESPHNDQKTKRLALRVLSKSVELDSPANLSFNNMNVDQSSKPVTTPFDGETDWDDEGWTHNPGWIPVEPDVNIDAILKDGNTATNCPAGGLIWSVFSPLAVEKYRLSKTN